MLAFEDLSPDGDREHFSDGISEEILNVLVRVEELDVTSRTSAFLYKGSQLRIPEIAAELRVRHVLEGSVRRAGDNIRITAQLIDAVDDTHLWSQTYDRPLTVENVFEVQDDIARAIVDALGEVLGLTASVTETHAAPTSDVEAYDLYLQARRYYRGRVDFASAESLLIDAVRRDPEFAEGWAQLAAVIEVAFAYESEMSFRPQLVHEYTGRALMLNPENALAHAVQGLAVLDTQIAGEHFVSIDWALALSRLARALELDPENTEALNWIGWAYSAVGELEQAQESFRRCGRLDPIHSACFANTVSTALALGELEEARDLMRLGLERGLTGRDANWLLVLPHLADRDVFLTYTSRLDLLRDFRDHVALYDALTSPGVDYAQLREKLNDSWRVNPPSEYSHGILMAALGDYSQGADPVTAWYPGLNHFRMSDSFKHQIRENGVLAYWQAHGFPPRCRAVGEDDFECD